MSVKAQSRFAAPYDLNGAFQYDPNGVNLSWKSEAPASEVPEGLLAGNTVLSFMACSADAASCQEHFGVAVSTTGNTNDADFTTLAEWTIMPDKLNQTPWLEYTVDLSAYA